MTLYKYSKILLIDDDIISCKTNEYILKQCFFAEEIVIRYSATTALAYLGDHSNMPEELPELIFLDLIMPTMDGFEFLKCFNGLNDIIHDHCAVIVLSSCMDYIDYQRSLANPYVINYLAKPLNVEELLFIKA